jgi:hypothetical protein
MQRALLLLSIRANRSRCPIGSYIKVEGRDKNYRVVGVVTDIKHKNLFEESRYFIYEPYQQRTSNINYLVVRSAGHSASFIDDLKRSIYECNKDVAISNIMPIEARIGKSLSIPIFRARFIESCTALALIVALVGVYGAAAFDITGRSHEFSFHSGTPVRAMINMFICEWMGWISGGAFVGGISAACLWRYFTEWSNVPLQINFALFAVSSLIIVTAFLVVILIPLLSAIRHERAKTYQAPVRGELEDNQFERF